MAMYSGFYPLKMVIIHSYVSLPEGTRNSVTDHQRQFSSSQKGDFPVWKVAGTQMEAAEASSQPGFHVSDSFTLGTLLFG